MKRMKKVWALVLALVMVLALGVTSAAAETAAVKIGDTPLTESKTYSTADLSGVLTEGTVTWNAETKTLTLNGAKIKVSATEQTSGGYGIAFTTAATIELQGTNTLTVEGTNDSQYSITSAGALTIQGSGSLAIEGPGYGVNVSDVLSILNTNLTVTKSKEKALSAKGMTISGSTLNLTETTQGELTANTTAIYSTGPVTIKDSVITAKTSGAVAIYEAEASEAGATAGVTISNSALELTVSATNASGGVGISAQSGLCYAGGTIDITVPVRMNVSEQFPKITGYSNPKYFVAERSEVLTQMNGAPTTATGFGNGRTVENENYYQCHIRIEEGRSQYYYTNPTTTETKGSPKTFDAGIGVYAVSALLSVTGGAWVVGKKHK